MTQRSPVRGMWRTRALRSVGIAEFGFTPSGRVTGNTRPLPLLAECSFAVPWRAKSRPFEVAPPNVGSADPNTRETLPPCHRSPQLRNAGSVRALSAVPALRGLCHGVDVLAVRRFSPGRNLFRVSRNESRGTSSLHPGVLVFGWRPSAWGRLLLSGGRRQWRAPGHHTHAHTHTHTHREPCTS